MTGHHKVTLTPSIGIEHSLLQFSVPVFARGGEAKRERQQRVGLGWTHEPGP